MLHGHGNYLVRFVAIGDELNGLSFRLRVFARGTCGTNIIWFCRPLSSLAKEPLVA